MKLQQIMSKTRKAVDDYHMIEEGDVIAIGISGGKDSLALLYSLAGMRRFYPKHYSLIAITCDLGFKNVDFSRIKTLCEKLDVEYNIVDSNIADIVFDERKEENPCSLCAKMRKGAMNDFIKERGCKKIAFAHHQDDVVDTYMLSLIYEGRQNTFSPVTFLDRSGVTLIRPFIYMKEADIKGFVKANNVPVLKSPCPVDGLTKRQYVKDLLKNINDDAPGVKDRIFTAIQNSDIKGWKLSEKK
ncbi:MAG: tRNA 2-thiocytidine(32) synthetase TtcA [Lachnospiraceae bacterium]|nr:tRNA 2-thiocytidine(32) synthetase TtcA [Lachnospiraceae bacterium]